ncbi:MAG TPA: hypothetical protein VIU38_06960 [Anaerolineales bacterium]
MKSKRSASPAPTRAPRPAARAVAPSAGPQPAGSGLLIIAAFALPLIAFWVDVAWLHPARNYYTVDTEFPYFLNSLSVFKGAGYTYVDHPGTPLEVFGSILLGLTYPFLARVGQGFVAFHIGHPGVFLDAARSLLMLAHGACAIILFLVAHRGNRWDDILEASAVATMYFAVHPYALAASTVWNHNSFSWALGALLLACLWRALHRPNDEGELPWRTLILLGAGAGALAAITIYLAAWLLGLLTAVAAFYVLRRRPWVRTAAALVVTAFSGAAGFGLAVLPVARKLPIFQNWILGILTHQSRYLAVPADEPTTTRIFANIGALFDILPALLVVAAILIGATAVALIVSMRQLRSQPATWAFIAGAVVQLASLLLVFLDRPLREAYLLSAAAVLPLLTMALLRLLDHRPAALRWTRILLGIGVLVGLATASWNSIATKRHETAALEATQADTSQLILEYAQATGREPNDVTVLWMYGAYSPCWGLRTGDALAGDTFAAEIDAVCPNQYRLSANLRYDVHGDGIAVQEGAWDIIFTCDQYLRRLIDSLPGAITERFESIQWGCGSMNEVRRQ